jgi:hypothetical protein
VPDGDGNIPIVAAPITLGSKSGSKSIQATSNATEKPILPMSRRIGKPNGADIGKKGFVLIYKTRSKDNPPKSLTSYGIYPVLIYKMS